MRIQIKGYKVLNLSSESCISMNILHVETNTITKRKVKFRELGFNLNT